MTRKPSDSNNKDAEHRAGHLKASELTEEDVEQLRDLAENTPYKLPWECFWKGKRFLVEELQRFLWYYDNKPELRDSMAVEYLVVQESVCESESMRRDALDAAVHTDEVMGLFLDYMDSGPLDGGCLVLAHALKNLHPRGEVVHLENAETGAVEHYGLMLPNGEVLDGDGRHRDDKAWMEHFAEVEHIYGKLKVGVGEPPYSNVPFSQEAVNNIADTLRRVLDVQESVCESVFSSGYCGEYAIALHEVTGYPIVVFEERRYDDFEEEDYWSYAHYAVRTPDGLYKDCDGVHTEDEIKAELLSATLEPLPPEDVRVREVSPEDIDEEAGVDEEALESARETLELSESCISALLDGKSTAEVIQETAVYSDELPITVVQRDGDHDYEYVNGIMYELSGKDDRIVDIDLIEATPENTFEEDQIERYIEYIEDGGVLETFPVQSEPLGGARNLSEMLEYLDDSDNFDTLWEIGSDLNLPKGYYKWTECAYNGHMHGVGYVDFESIRTVEDLAREFGPNSLDDFDEEEVEAEGWEWNEDMYRFFEAILEHWEDAQEYTLTDMNHRFEAVKRLGKKAVYVEVV